MYNELIFLALAAIELCAVTLLARFGKEWLYGSILGNLVLISIFGAQTVTVFGFTTNSGNIFYAAVVYAIYLLIEFYGGSVARRSIWISACLLAVFVLVTQLSVALIGATNSGVVTQALKTLFQFVPRIAVGSVVAFVMSQLANVFIYEGLRRRFLGQHLWLRNIVGVTLAQAIDSALFFSIAFWGFLSGQVLLESMITGFAVKVAVGILSTPFLYFALRLRPSSTPTA